VSITGRFKSLWPRKKTPPLRRPDPAPARRPSPLASADRRPESATAGLPRFHTTAGDHVDRERSDPRARERVRLRNSFMPAQPVADPRMFAGRRDILEVLIRAVEDQRSHVMIFGERGAGKTSLLRMLSRAAGEAKYIVVYFSCGATSDFSETFRQVATEIPLLYHSSISADQLEHRRRHLALGPDLVPAS
jgi:transcriptional regulator of acetoin/glycerol metabolism